MTTETARPVLTHNATGCQHPVGCLCLWKPAKAWSSCPAGKMETGNGARENLSSWFAASSHGWAKGPARPVVKPRCIRFCLCISAKRRLPPTPAQPLDCTCHSVPGQGPSRRVQCTFPEGDAHPSPCSGGLEVRLLGGRGEAEDIPPHRTLS